MPDPSTQLATPDPLQTTEVIVGGIATAVITNVIILFKLNITDVQQAALITLVNTVIAAVILVHGAIVRKGRAVGNASR
jgi:hypothetical protein